MTTVAIPAWNALGVLPPIDKNTPVSPERSPYHVTLKDVVMRFATSAQRKAVLRGFLCYRECLHRIGLVDGFQWIDGSFLEDIETIEKRPPGDIDIVTFCGATAGLTLAVDDEKLFDQVHVKSAFKVDAYFVELDTLPARELALWSAYWYSMWSHRRTGVWKGFLQIDLTPTDDDEAKAWLDQSDKIEDQP